MEIWKEIESYPDYQCSNIGRVKSLKYGKERIMKQTIMKNGYLCVPLFGDEKQKLYLVHRLIAQTFLDNPQNLPCINHKNEQKTDNRVDNLEWCSYQYNNNYGAHNLKIAISHMGLKHTQETKDKIGKGHQKPNVQLTKNGEFIKQWDSATQAGIGLNINHKHISECCKGKRNSCGGFKWAYAKNYYNARTLSRMRDIFTKLSELKKGKLILAFSIY